MRALGCFDVFMLRIHNNKMNARAWVVCVTSSNEYA